MIGHKIVLFKTDGGACASCKCGGWYAEGYTTKEVRDAYHDHLRAAVPTPVS